MSTIFSNLRETLNPRRPARRRSFSPAVEGLCQRTLPAAGIGQAIVAHAPLAMHAPHHGKHAHPVPPHHGKHAHPAPPVQPTPPVQQNDLEDMGLVIKAPQNRVFYEHYVGQQLSELNAIGAIGQLLPNGDFQFTGLNGGSVSPNVQATYVWGIDRNGNLPTGPFPDRPDIRFDATVAVKVVPGQTPTVTVTDLVSKKVTTLPLDQQALIPGNDNSLSVVIPGSLLPSTGLAPSQYRYAYWPEDGQAGATHIASFAPGFHDIQVGVPA